MWPNEHEGRHGDLYLITFIYSFKHFCHIYLISHKLEALNCYRHYLIEVRNQLGKGVKTLKTDQGHEYLSKLFQKHLWIERNHAIINDAIYFTTKQCSEKDKSYTIRHG